MAYGFVEPLKIAAKDIDSLGDTFINASEVMEQGQIFSMGAYSTTAGEEEAFVPVTPATGSLDGLYMLINPVLVETDSKYRGIDPDPRNYTLAANKPGTGYLLQVGDRLFVTDDALAGTKSTNTFLNAADSADFLTWGATQTASALSFAYLKDATIAIPDGSIGGQRVSGYVIRCIAN